jgi:gliding motility-associated-like protein
MRLLLEKVFRCFCATALALVAFLALSPVMYAQTTEPCISPASPVINGSSSGICRGESTQLSATNCAGTIIWSTGETGNQIAVNPLQTTKYTALCRSPKGCLSCFADAWTVRVNTPAPPIVTPSAFPVCAGDEVTLTASQCAGSITWPDGSTGNTLALRINQSMSFAGVICAQKGCTSVGSVPIEIAVGVPQKPVLSVNKSSICIGQSVDLTATNCLGEVRWSDGGRGISRVVSPAQSRSYRAVCRMGSCQSDSSEVLVVTVNASNLKPVLTQTAFTNGCPYQTADLTRAVPSDASLNPPGNWLFRTSTDPNSPAVQSPRAAENGDYYLFLRTNDGCYSEPVKLSAQITPCKDGIAPCMSNPARMVVWADSLNTARGSVILNAQLRGVANNPQWSGTGTGLLIAPNGISTRYLFSEADQQRGSVVFALTTPDPDGGGPCHGAFASLTVTLPFVNVPGAEVIGLSKKVFEPTWLPNGEVELVYQLTVANMGKNPLTRIQIVDNLDQAFGASGANIRAVTARADSGWAINPAFTGRGADTTLLMAEANLGSGQQRNIRLLVRLNIGQANTMTFANQAHGWALDVNGGLCRDKSANGNDPDPDRNGNPGDNNEPTLITLQSVATEGEVFIPEGFSPNDDGINDRFIVSRVPTGTTLRLRVFNRWGHQVFVSDDYQNDWNGTANTGTVTGNRQQGLPEGTYFYVLSLSDGREYSRFITLNR